MSIYFSSNNGAVPQHILNHTQVGTILIEVGRKGMAKSVWAYIFANPSNFGKAFDDGIGP